MRISCRQIEDFFSNLTGVKVYQRTVYVDKLVTILNGRTKADATSFEIGLRVGAVLQFEDGGESLVEAAEICGIDRLTADGGAEGSQQQAELLQRVHRECERLGLQVRPGTLDL